MALLWGIVVFVFFLFLIQWNRVGMVLRNLLSTERARDKPCETSEEAEGFLRFCFKVIGVLAVAMWISLGIIVVLDLAGIDWMSGFFGNPQAFRGSPLYNSFITAPKPRQRMVP